jgi:capsular polysaccharide transport system permease protein
MSLSAHNPRTSWQITRSVWYALFMREAVSRTMADQFAWFWMIAEPMLMVALMVAIRAFAAGGLHLTAGADFIGWSVIGLLSFFIYRECAIRSIGAIEANQGLFTYRQVLPVDTVLVRCFLEGVLKSFILLLFISIGAFLQLDIIPDDPLGVIFDWCGLWVLGTGSGLTLAALSSLVPDIGRIMRIATLPLLLISGTLMPLNFFPHSVLEYLLWNPILHGIEEMRGSFYSGYEIVDGVSSFYLWLCAIVSVVIGLGLNIFFAEKLKAL